MAKRVNLTDIKKMNELYLTLKTYAAVAREVGFSASTVKKYIEVDYVSEKDKTITLFTGSFADVDTLKFPQSTEEWNKYLEPTEEEIKDLNNLRKEI